MLSLVKMAVRYLSTQVTSFRYADLAARICFRVLAH